MSDVNLILSRSRFPLTVFSFPIPAKSLTIRRIDGSPFNKLQCSWPECQATFSQKKLAVKHVKDEHFTLPKSQGPTPLEDGQRQHNMSGPSTGLLSEPVVTMPGLPEHSEDDDTVLSTFRPKPSHGRTAAPSAHVDLPDRTGALPVIVQPAAPIASAPEAVVPVAPNVDGLRALEVVKQGLKCPM